MGIGAEGIICEIDVLIMSITEYSGDVMLIAAKEDFYPLQPEKVF